MAMLSYVRNKKEVDTGICEPCQLHCIGQKVNFMLSCIVTPTLPVFKRKEKNMLGKNVAADGEYVKYIEDCHDKPRYSELTGKLVDEFWSICQKDGLAVREREGIYTAGIDLATEFEKTGFEAGTKWVKEMAIKPEEKEAYHFDESKCTMIETIMNRMREMNFRLDLMADNGYEKKKVLSKIYWRMKKEYGIPLDFIVQKADNGGELPYFSTFEAVAIEKQLYDAFILIGNDMCGIEA